jgi:hypothetical protein
VEFKKKLGKVAKVDRALKGAATFSTMTPRRTALSITMKPMKKGMLTIRIKKVALSITINI